MLQKHPLWLIDAFTKDIFKGNPAGVCFVENFPDDAVMQNIAFEMHWSETAFLKPLAPNKFHIRWFAPEDEAPICGHATLAASHFLFENKKIQGHFIEFQSQAGLLTVTQDYLNQEPWLVMNFPSCFLEVCQDPHEIDSIKKVLNTTIPERVFKDPFIYVVILKSEKEVLNCIPHLDFLTTLPCRALTITAPSNLKDYDFVSRYFAPKVGIPEDPVCGSAHCRLAPLWSRILNKKTMNAHQISRRGGILQVSYDPKTSRVYIAGQARTVLKGEVIF